MIKRIKKNVQDAHEAIRPTSLKYTPQFVKPYLDEPQFKLYDLIWKRFVACQMESARLETTTISISADEYVFKSSGTAILFDGFMAIYDEDIEDNIDQNGNNGLIPVGLIKNQMLGLKEIAPIQHFTKPPARFTESSLIKELESKLECALPQDYRDFLLTTNGFDGFIGDFYAVFESVDRISECTKDNCSEFFPWAIYIGTNGNLEMFVMDKRTNPYTYGLLPFIADDNDFIPLSKDFERFILRLFEDKVFTK